MGYAHYQLGRIFNDGGEHREALRSRQRSLKIRQEIAAQDAKNQQARFDLATSHGELAETYAPLGAPAEALEHGRKSLELLTELTTADPNNAVYRRNLGLCYERIAGAHAVAASDPDVQLAERQTQLTEARSYYGKAHDVFAELRDRGALMPTDTQNIERYATKVTETEQALASLGK